MLQQCTMEPCFNQQLEEGFCLNFDCALTGGNVLLCKHKISTVFVPESPPSKQLLLETILKPLLSIMAASD